ncbi:MAG: error-prone DNA polymerase [Phycisphaeraceae bacterium]|nr:error-prone DNA polymerase [Phycisphaeraceae bacterium]
MVPKYPINAAPHPSPLPSPPEGSGIPSPVGFCRAAVRPYAELGIISNFSFLTGASHPHELVEQAANLGLEAIGLADINTLAGIVRGHVAAKEAGFPLRVGSRLRIDLTPPGDDQRRRHARSSRTAPPTVSAAAEDLTRLSDPAAGFNAPWVGTTPGRRPSGITDQPADPAHVLELLVYPTSIEGYTRLSRLLTLGRRNAPKGFCELRLVHLLATDARDWQVVILPPRKNWGQSWIAAVRSMQDTWPQARAVTQLGLIGSEHNGARPTGGDSNLSLAVCAALDGRDQEHLARVLALGRDLGIPLLAIQDVQYHHPSRRALHDVLCCIRHNRTLDEAGRRLSPHGNHHLQSPARIASLFGFMPRAIDRSIDIARKTAGFNLDQLRYEYPEETCPDGSTPIAHLAELTRQGARERYPRGVPERITRQIDHEMKLIDALDYAPYFLTVYDIVRFARGRGILCQGRGAAANSAVCFCLGITSVDPDRINLLFERFISQERNEPPDIDVDFEHERREEVIQYIYRRFGRHRSALTAVVTRFRTRSAIRQVGKAMGLNLDLVDRMARNIGHHDLDQDIETRLRETGVDPRSGLVRLMLEHVRRIHDFPRHLSQHVGGFVITRRPLCDLVPIQNATMADRTVIEWDKDDVDAMGMLKIDVLALGMLSCVRKSLDMITQLEAPRPALDLAGIPAEDPTVYDMICRADTVGVFQIESRAQMSMLPRLKPRNFYDLVIEVAIVRPGPIHGRMVHPYLRRRRGEEPVTYPDERVREVLGRTLGVPLFQEQVMTLAVAAAGFTPGEADNLRRAIAAWKGKGKVILRFGQRIIEGMVARGYDQPYAQRVFEQIKGFGEYGFPESHAASFALIVYASAWIKCHYPAVFAASLINSQPMGFYAPAQIIADAQRHGVEVRPVDLNFSRWDCTLEPIDPADRPDRLAQPPRRTAMRLGFRLVRGLSLDQAMRLDHPEQGSWKTLEQVRRATGLGTGALRNLARADAMQSLGLNRQEALWAVAELSDDALPILEATADDTRESPAGTMHAIPEDALPHMPAWRQVMIDYERTGFSLKAHPVSFLRDWMNQHRITANRFLADPAACPHKSPIHVAGLVLMRQKPSTAKGILFMTLEDETGIANLIIRPDVYKRCRAAARHSVLALARGRIERQGPVVHVLVQSIEDLGRRLPTPAAPSRDFR